MKIVKHNIPIYFGRLDIVVAKDFKKAAAKLKMKWDNHDISSYSSFTYQRLSKKGYTRYVVFSNPNNTPGVIAHEAGHIVNSIFNDRHIKLDIHNDEPQAYLLGWVVSKIHEALKK